MKTFLSKSSTVKPLDSDFYAKHLDFDQIIRNTQPYTINDMTPR